MAKKSSLTLPQAERIMASMPMSPKPEALQAISSEM
jgi:hypothetical protein